MNINQKLTALGLVIISAGAMAAAYGLRYVPINGDGYTNAVLVWDRWSQQVCQVTFNGVQTYCSQVRTGIVERIGR